MPRRTTKRRKRVPKPAVDKIIKNIWALQKKEVPSISKAQPHWLPSEAEVIDLCLKAREIFASQPMLLELDPPIKIVGDTHGQLFDVFRVLDYGGDPRKSNYLFLGDMIDRGKHSLENICLLLAYKIKRPENFFLLRGNHESAEINGDKRYGFIDDCMRFYNKKIWSLFNSVFNYMPVCAIVADQIMCMHGGISPTITNLSQIASIPRPIVVPQSGILTDLLWSDPTHQYDGWGHNKSRMISYAFGKRALEAFMDKFGLSLVVRAHQVVQEGYEFFANKKLVTIFSAPNYANQASNSAAILNVSEDLNLSIKQLKPIQKLQ